jgi:hypothetical protein
LVKKDLVTCWMKKWKTMSWYTEKC